MLYALKGSLDESYFTHYFNAVIVLVVDESPKVFELLHHLEKLVSDFKM
jgi:hypothetical protein